MMMMRRRIMIIIIIIITITITIPNEYTTRMTLCIGLSSNTTLNLLIIAEVFLNRIFHCSNITCIQFISLLPLYKGGPG